jgi:hypothetical protein
MSLIGYSHCIDQGDKPADVYRFDRPPGGKRKRLGNRRVFEDDVAPAGLADVDAMRDSNRLEPADPPIAGICSHPIERFVGTRHSVPIMRLR